MTDSLYAERRNFIAGAVAVSIAGSAGLADGQTAGMYGLIGKMTARAGQRAALVDILIAGVSAMPGCLSYIVANDPADADTIWITEVWESQAAHAASLSLPSVRDAITRGRPLIAGMQSVAQTAPVGGTGLGQR